MRWLFDEGGDGRPIVLLHGLMGSAATWFRHIDWLREFGHVYTFTALGHGRPDPDPIATETFVADLAEHLAPLAHPVTIIGHSMGGLHGWCYAAAYPERVHALVVEDICPDFRGGTAEPWLATIRSWPQPFADEQAVLDYFGPIAGEYFARSFTRRPDGLYLHGEVDTFGAISLEWGDRHFWDEWANVQCPTLLIEAENSVTIPGQMREMARRKPELAEYALVQGSGHLIHDEKPDEYERLVRKFLNRVHVGSDHD